MRSWMDLAGEVVWEPSPSLIAQLIGAGQPFWLDIEDPTEEIIDELATRLGLHLATVNRRLAAVATIFLPISFLAGFFGQNFSVLVAGIQGWPTFLVLGVGLSTACVAVTVFILSRRNWN